MEGWTETSSICPSGEEAVWLQRLPLSFSYSETFPLDHLASLEDNETQAGS